MMSMMNDDPLISVLLLILFPLFCFVSFVDCYRTDLCHFSCSVILTSNKVNFNAAQIEPYLVSYYIKIPMCNHIID